MAHELAHARLDRPHTLAQSEALYALTETEAESVAYIVATVTRLEADGYSFPYIVHWSAGTNPHKLTAAIGDVAKRTAGAILARLAEPPAASTALAA